MKPPTDLSVLARAQAPYLVESNLDALVIYPAPLGGWHADVLLKNVPDGVANSLGSPSHLPKRTLPEAETMGRTVLALCLCMSRTAPRQTPAVFLLCGWAVPLTPEMFDGLNRRFDAETPGGREVALRLIEGLLSRLCPQGFNGDDFNRTWCRLDRTQLLAALHLAAMAGVLAYPPRYHATPSGHRESPGARQ